MQTPVLRIQQLLDSFTNEDWNNLYKRLRLFAYKRYGRLKLFSSSAGRQDLEDLIHDAVFDLIRGVRVWPDNVELFVFLCGVIRSKVYHKGARERKRELLQETSQLNKNPSSLAQQEEDHAHQQAIEVIRKLVCDDPVSKQIVEKWLENPDMRPRDLAGELGLSIAEVRHALKRLKRKLKNLRQTGSKALR